MPTQRISLDLSTETIRYLDHCKTRSGFKSRSEVVEAVLSDALEDWEEWKDAQIAHEDEKAELQNEKTGQLTIQF